MRPIRLLTVILCVGSLAAACTAANLRDGLVAYYQFDDDLTDASGEGHDASPSGGGPAEFVDGFLGQAVDTRQTAVDCGTWDPSDENTDAFSASCWVYWLGLQGAAAQWQGILAKRTGWGAGLSRWQLELGDNSATAYLTNQPNGGAGSVTLTQDEWQHIVISFDGSNAAVYLDGEQVGGGGWSLDDDTDATLCIGMSQATNANNFNGYIDEVAFWNRGLSQEEIALVYNSGEGQSITGPPVTATKPSPANGALDVPRDVALTWTPSESAASHNVYFGTSWDAVNDASLDAPMGVLVGQGRDANSFQPEGVLGFGQTYYWRVDEVNAPPDSTVFPGPVWSFTVEPFAYPIQNVTATASSATTAKGMTPDKTVDGSGMDGDEHSMEEADMWLSAPFAPLPAWIQYEFDDIYKLHELWVWNSNQTVEGFIGFGARDVTAEYSLDGVEWSTLGDVELARAPGDVGYTYNTVVDLVSVQAKFVRLTIHSNWGGIVPQVGLSEVRFFHIPVKARQPSPASGGEDVPLDVVLTWRPGREATSHEVYLSGDRQAVVEGTAPMETVGEARFEPSGLEYGRFYYWKVNEVNDADATTWEGDIWSFSTIEYMVVDDFESYTDDIEAGETIWQTWLDGLTNNTGSVVGYFEAPFAERRIVHGGSQSMPMDYNNVNSPYYSEAERTFDPVQDWTAHGATDLVLWYRGYPVPFVENADGSIVMSGSGHDIWDAADDFRFAYHQLSGDGSIVARVDSLANTNPWAKAGVMIRESLSDDARCAYMVVTPASGVSFQWRAFVGVTPESVTQAGIVAPQYVKLTRKGNVFTAQYSADGSAWQDLTKADGTPVSVSMAGNPLIGLCVTSHDAALVTTAEFSEITSSGTGPWQVAAIGDDPEPGNDADDLYVVIRDSGNKTAVVTNPDPAAVNATEWTEWKIPLSEFTSAGVKMNAVKTIMIGIGNRAAPMASAAGTVYVDDIGYGHSLP